MHTLYPTELIARDHRASLRHQAEAERLVHEGERVRSRRRHVGPVPHNSHRVRGPAPIC